MYVCVCVDNEKFISFLKSLRYKLVLLMKIEEQKLLTFFTSWLLLIFNIYTLDIIFLYMSYKFITTTQ